MREAEQAIEHLVEAAVVLESLLATGRATENAQEISVELQWLRDKATAYRQTAAALAKRVRRGSCGIRKTQCL